jgi:pimeloyl-ACP methyl ester carboxylesterase
MPQVICDGIRIHYDDLGYGEPALLLLPGWCEPRTGFGQLVLRCATAWRVLMPDWRGHGESEASGEDFGAAELLRDALAVIDASAARNIIPVAVSHAGWIAIELRRRLGHRIPRLILLDWLLTRPGADLLRTLEELQQPRRWQAARERLLSDWLGGSLNLDLTAHIHQDMMAFDFAMWARAAREISLAYNDRGSPLKVLGGLLKPPPTLHLYAQPDNPDYLTAQQRFAADHPWFNVRKIEARSHFPALEAPDAVAAAINEFLR